MKFTTLGVASAICVCTAIVATGSVISAPADKPWNSVSVRPSGDVQIGDAITLSLSGDDDPKIETRVVEINGQQGGSLALSIDGNSMLLNGSMAGLPEKRLNVDFKDIPVRDAIKQLFEMAGLTVEVMDDVPADKTVSISAKNVLFSRALSLVLDVAGSAQWRGDVKDGKTVYKVGRKLPAGRAGFNGFGQLGGGLTFAGPNINIAHGNSFPDVKVTLKLDNVPLADALKQLFTAANLELEVEKDFGKDKRVTADIKDAKFREAYNIVMNGAGPHSFNMNSVNGKTSYKIGTGRAGFSTFGPLGNTVLAVPGQFNPFSGSTNLKWETAPRVFSTRGAALPDVKVSVEFRNTPLRDAVQKLFAEAKTNVVVEDDIPNDKRISMTLRDVKFSRALDIVLDQAEAGWTSEGEPEKRIFKVGKKYARPTAFNLLGVADPKWDSFLSTTPRNITRRFNETRTVFTCPVTKKTMIVVTQDGKAPSWKTCPFCGKSGHTGPKDKSVENDRASKDIY